MITLVCWLADASERVICSLSGISNSQCLGAKNTQTNYSLLRVCFNFFAFCFFKSASFFRAILSNLPRCSEFDSWYQPSCLPHPHFHHLPYKPKSNMHGLPRASSLPWMSGRLMMPTAPEITHTLIKHITQHIQCLHPLMQQSVK